MDQWLKLITDWIIGLVKAVLGFVADIIRDAVVWVLDAILGALGSLLAAIPAPSFMASGGGLGDIFTGLPPFALYVMSNARLAEAFAIISAGVGFYLLRKIFTLGQW